MIKTEKSLNDYIKDYKKQPEFSNTQKAYQGIMKYITSLRNHFKKEYPDEIVVGNIYPGQMDITHFPVTPKSLKKHKLKTVLIFNHEKVRFEIWLVGQNKQIQKEYWEIFKGSDWDKYHIAQTTDKKFSIVEGILTENPDFDNPALLTELVESNTMQFIKNIAEALDVG